MSCGYNFETKYFSFYAFAPLYCTASSLNLTASQIFAFERKKEHFKINIYVIMPQVLSVKLNLDWTEILLNTVNLNCPYFYQPCGVLRIIRNLEPRNVLEHWIYVKTVSFVNILSMLGWCASVNRKCKHFLPFICFPLCHKPVCIETLYSSLVCCPWLPLALSFIRLPEMGCKSTVWLRALRRREFAAVGHWSLTSVSCYSRRFF